MVLAAAYAGAGFGVLLALGSLALAGFAVLAFGALDAEERSLLRRPGALLRPHGAGSVPS